MIWSAAGDYSFAPDFRAFDRLGQADVYWNFILGAAHRYFDMTAIRHFLELCQNQFEAELFVNLTWIALEHSIYEKARDSWVNLEAMRMEYAEHYIRDLDITQLVEYFDMVKLAYFKEILEGVPKAAGTQQKLLEELKIPGTADTEEVILRLKQLFKTYFYREIKEGTGAKLNLSLRLHLPGGKPGMALRLLMRRAGLLRAEVVTGIVPEAVLQEKTASRFHFAAGRTLREDIEEHYGTSLLTGPQTQHLEEEECQGTHEGLHIHLAGSDLRDEGGETARQTRNNLEYYRSHLLRNRNIVARLTQNIAEVLARETTVETAAASQGSLVGRKCYRALYLGDHKIFEKRIWHESFDLSFDILVDASASQLKRQEEIAQAAYIMASAFTANHIPVRVMTYKSIREYLVLNVLKDYQDRSGEGIFSYFASGFNRDGLAVRTALKLMENTGSRQKYLIVISDGNPSDITGIRSSRFLGRAADYGGRAAVEDLAREVTKGKSQGIRIVGLLIGREENLAAQEMIFGQNLLHLKDPIHIADSLLRVMSS